MFLVPLLFGLTLSGQVVVPVEPDVTELSEVAVIGARPTWLLSVVVDGETDATSLVTGATEIRCGPAKYRYEDFGRPRLCWARRDRGETVTLTAQAQGRPARVDWTGCTNVTAEGACVATLNADTTISVQYRQSGG